MGITTHNWNGPIATLTSEYWESRVDWRGPIEKKFQGGLSNFLKFEIEFKYRKPYGGDARFWVRIDRVFGEDLRLIHAEEFVFWVDPPDDDWKPPVHQEFKIYFGFPCWVAWSKSKEWKLKFRITAQIQEEGNYPSGSSGGSSGGWSEPKSKDYTAIFSSPGLKETEARIIDLRKHLDDLLIMTNKQPR